MSDFLKFLALAVVVVTAGALWLRHDQSSRTSPQEEAAREADIGAARRLLLHRSEFTQRPIGSQVSDSPKVKPKIVAMSMREGLAITPSSLLPDRAARDPAEVETIVQITESTEQVGHYTKTRRGARVVVWRVVIIDRATKVMLCDRVFRGEMPPEEVTTAPQVNTRSGMIVEGPRPEAAVTSFLNSLELVGAHPTSSRPAPVNPPVEGSQDAPKARFCTNCGARLVSGARYCGNCGAAVSGR